MRRGKAGRHPHKKLITRLHRLHRHSWDTVLNRLNRHMLFICLRKLSRSSFHILKTARLIEIQILIVPHIAVPHVRFMCLSAQQGIVEILVQYQFPASIGKLQLKRNCTGDIEV